MMATAQVGARVDAPRASEAGRYDAFISYSRRDGAFVEQLCADLRAGGKEVWLDLDISGGARWRERVALGIEACKSLVFVVSPDSLGSEACLGELHDAVALNKLVIPIIYRDAESELPRTLAESEWILLRESDDRSRGVRLLVEALEADLEWRDQHTRLAGRAREWLESDRNSSYLLRGADLREAERWLASQAGHREAATREQGEYIARSRHAATRRLYTLIGGLGAGLAISVALAVFAFLQRAHAVHQTHIAQSRQLAAETAGDPYLTLASLMALGAYKLSRTIEARSAILSVADSHQLGGAVPAGGGVVKHIAFSRRGDLLASGGTDRAVRLWSTATHQEVGPPLRGSVEKVNSVAFSPRRPILATASDAGDVHLWNTRTFRPVGTPLISANARTGYPGQAFDVAFSPDGKILAVAFTNSIRLFNVPRHRELRPIAVPNYPVMDVAFSPNGRVLAAGVNDGTVRFWDARTGRQLGGNLRSGCGVVNGVAFSPDSRTLAAACTDNSIRLWSVRTRTPFATLTGHTEPVNAVAFSPDGSTLVSGSADRSVRLWSIATRREIGAPLTGTEGSVYTVAYDPDGTTVASASNDQAIRFWRVASPRQIGAPIGGGDGHVTMAFSPNGSEIVAGYHDGWLRLWNVRTRRQLLTLNEKAGPVDSVAFSPSGNTFAVAYAWGVLGIFNLHTNQVRGGVYDTFAKSWNPVETRLSFSPSGRFLAVVDENPGDDYQGAVTVYSTSTYQPVGSQFAGSEDVAFGRNERVAAVGGPYEDLTIRLRILRTGAEHVLRGHTGSVNALAFSPDRKLLASGSADDTLRLWNPATGLPVGGPLTGHSGSINAVTFSPDGTQIATGATDDTIRIWDVASRQELGSPLTGDTAPITSLAFNPSGRILASGSDDGTVRLWSNDPIGTYIAQLCGYIPSGSGRGVWQTGGVSVPYQTPPCHGQK